MLDLKTIVSQPETILASLQKRNQREQHQATIDEIISLDKVRRESLQEVEALKAKRN